MSTNSTSRPVKPTTRGPILMTFEMVMGLLMVSVSACVLGLFIELAGIHTIWKDQGTGHARSIVEQDLSYIEAAPKSLIIPNTVAFSNKMLGYISWPYEKFGILQWYANSHDPAMQRQQALRRAQEMKANGNSLSSRLKTIGADASQFISTVLVLSMYVAMDVALRLSIALYALPAFVLACLVGAVDGLVRRDLRRWSGGRESSFVYHHAKRYTAWALTGGFGLYLTWPFGGFNPAYMVLIFTALVAATLSTTVASLKKYM